MRLFFLFFILSWLLGLILSVAGFSIVIVGAVAALLGVTAFLFRQTPQVSLALVALAMLGFLWADMANRGGPACDVLVLTSADVAAQVRVGDVHHHERWVRFVGETVDGCRVLVTADRFAGVREGDEILAVGGEVQSLAEVADFSVGYARYLERQSISGTWFFPDTTVVHVGGGWTQKWHGAINARVGLVFVEPDASVVRAVLFAERGTLPDDLVGQFRATGVSHVLAISGLHVSLLVGMLVGLMLLVPVGPVTRTVLILTTLWLYIWFIGAPTSAVRAAAFWTVTLAALRLHLLISLPTVLLLAATTLATLKPVYLTDVGFQLSVSAVAGIWLALFLARPLLRRWRQPLRGVASLVLVSLGASLATGPLVAWHFGNVAPAGVITNLLVVPLVPALLLVAILALLTSLVSMPAALGLTLLLHGVIGWIILVTRVISGVPGVFYEEVSIPLWAIPVYYLAFAGLGVLVMRFQRRSWREMWVP